MTDEDVFGLETREGRPRRGEPEQWMHAEGLAAHGHVADGPEGVGRDEDAARGPPERDLAPDPAPDDRAELEGRLRQGLEGRLVHRDAESLREPVRVAAMPVEEDEHARRLAEGTDPLVDSRPVHGIDDVHASVRPERVRRAPERVVRVEPPEPEVRLVAEADQANVRLTLWRPSTIRSISSGSV